MFLSKFFKRFTSDKKGSSASDGSPEHTFAVRHHRFKLFLTAWNKFQENMTSLEYTLCCDHPFGLHRVRALWHQRGHAGVPVHPASRTPQSFPVQGPVRTLRPFADSGCQ